VDQAKELGRRHFFLRGEDISEERAIDIFNEVREKELREELGHKRSNIND
jgi:hypothetical protein